MAAVCGHCLLAQGFLNVHISAWMRRLLTRVAALIPAALLQYLWGDRATYNFLLIAQVSGKAPHRHTWGARWQSRRESSKPCEQISVAPCVLHTRYHAVVAFTRQGVASRLELCRSPWLCSCQ
jgi:hypothetical protein